MKLRPFIILLLFVVSLGILAWMYYTATNSPARHKESSLHEILLDLRECARTKHVKSMQYAQFAAVADRESEHAAARLFRALALSEEIHEKNCIEAIDRLGGTHTPPEKVVVFEGKTDDNLASSLTFGRQLHADRSNSNVDRALQSGNRYAARILIWSDGSDIQHICLLEHCANKQPPHEGYVVCSICGLVYPAELAARYCPFCQTSDAEFLDPELTRQ